jgi:hypothetical protein
MSCKFLHDVHAIKSLVFWFTVAIVDADDFVFILLEYDTRYYIMGRVITIIVF